MLKMGQMAQGNRDLAITPDGPRGPRYVVQNGVIFLAQKTGRPIIPAGIGLDRYWQMPSWDEFRVPKPFSRATIFVGEPIRVPGEVSKDALRLYRDKLENELLELTARAEKAALEWKRNA